MKTHRTPRSPLRLLRNRLKKLHGVALFGLLLALPLAHAGIGAQTFEDTASYPAHPIKIVVTFPPGGGTDLLARKLGGLLAERIGQTVVIENRPGASGNIGARAVAESAPDGYTLLMVNSTFAVNPAVFHKLPFSPQDDFAAIINVGFVPSVVLVPADSPAHTLNEWLASARADAPQAYATCGNGTPQHMAGEMLARASTQTLQQIPYKGCGSALTAVAGGQVGAAIVTASSATPLIQSGQVRALAITSAQRSALLPDVPTVAEQGWPGYHLDQWHGLVAPAGTPADIIDRLNAHLHAIVNDPDVQRWLHARSFQPAPSTPAAFSAMIQADLHRFAEVADLIELRLD